MKADNTSQDEYREATQWDAQMILDQLQESRPDWHHIGQIAERVLYRARFMAGQTGTSSATSSTEPLPQTIVAADGAEMVLIPAGEFVMGTSQKDIQAHLRVHADWEPEWFRDEQPAHVVCLDAFYLDRYEVTNAQWQRFVAENPAWRKDQIQPEYHDGQYLEHWRGENFPQGRENSPVIGVSWYAAAAYADWAGKRLPTEAEWEKAARGEPGYYYAYGYEYDETKANLGRRVGDLTPVGQYEPNDYGLYDLIGNVYEWGADWYALDYYRQSEVRNPAGPAQGHRRVARGGAWGHHPFLSRAAKRHHYAPTRCSGYVGLRLAKSVE